MQDSIDAFEIRMGEFSKLFHLDLDNPNRLALLENNCKYFANLFADLLRENYKLKDQIIDNVRQIRVYREELMKLVNEFDQNRKFKKEMATIEELLILITQDKTQLELQIKSQQDLLLQKSNEISFLTRTQHESDQTYKEKSKQLKNKYNLKIQQYILDYDLALKKMEELEAQKKIQEQELRDCVKQIGTLESELDRKQKRIQQLQRMEQEFSQRFQDLEFKSEKLQKEQQKKFKDDLQQLRNQNNNHIQQIQSNYEEKLSIKADEIQQLELRLDEKVKELFCKQTEYEQLQLRFMDFQELSSQKQEELQNQINARDQQVVMLVKSLNGIQTKYDDSEQNLNLARTEIESLSSKLKEAEKEINHHKIMIQQLNTKISDDKKRNSRIIEDLNKNHKQEINDQYEQLQNLMDNKLSQQQQDSEHQLKLKMDNKQIEINGLKRKLEEEKLKFERMEIDFKEQIFQFHSKIQNLKQSQTVIQQDCQRQLQLKDSQIQAHQNEIDQIKLSNIAQQTKNDSEKAKLIKKYEDEIKEISKSSDHVVKQVVRQMEDKQSQLLEQLDTQHRQLLSYQGQIAESTKLYQEMEQKNNRRIAELQDECQSISNSFIMTYNKLDQKIKRVIQQCDQLKSRCFNISQIVKQKDQEISNLNQKLQDADQSYQNLVQQNQQAIINFQQQLAEDQNQLEKQYKLIFEQKEQKQLDNLKMDKLQLKLSQEEEGYQIEKQNWEKQLESEKLQQTLLLEQFQKEEEILNSKILDLHNQIKNNDKIWLQRLQQKQINHDKFTETELPLITEQVVQEKIKQQLDQVNESYSLEKAQLIVQYEQIIEEMSEKISKRKKNDNLNVQGLQELLEDENKELMDVKKQATAQQLEFNQHINDLNQKYQIILETNASDIQDLQEQITKLNKKNEELLRFIDLLQKEQIENDLNYNLQLQQLKEQSEAQLRTVTETCNQEVEDCKKQYEDNHQKYDELMKTYQKRKATPEDTELIKNLLKDHQELYEQVGIAFDKVKEANDIIRYLDLEIQHFKKSNDIFGGTSSSQINVNTQKMMQRVTQLRQDVESVQNRIISKQSQHSMELIIEKPKSNQSDYSEYNYPIERLSSMKRKKLPKVLTSLRSNTSDVGEQFSQTQTQPYTSQQQQQQQQQQQFKSIPRELPIFSLEQESTPTEQPTSFNAFLDQRQHQQKNQNNQNKYTVYIEKKKKELVNISDIVTQQQISPSESKNQKKTHKTERFLPYYLRNVDAKRPKSLKRELNLNLNGNSVQY